VALRSRRLLVGLCLLALLVACGFAHAEGLTANPTAITGGTAGFGARSRWNAVIVRFAQQQADPAAVCAAGSDPSHCPPVQWLQRVATLRDLPSRARRARQRRNQPRALRPGAPAAALPSPIT